MILVFLFNNFNFINNINIETIKTLIGSGIDINSKDYDNRTALHLAVAQGHFEMVKYLIQNGAKLLKDRSILYFYFMFY
jgi:ankyrin repeat protein